MRRPGFARPTTPAGPIRTIAWSKEAEPRLLAPRMLWGFPLPGGEAATINARSETADTKSAFRGAFRHRRCAVPVNGFYEWEKRAGGKQPWFFQPRDGGVVAIAGIYAPLPEPVQGLRYGACLLTTAPCPEVTSVHHRMPVVLTPAAALTWVSPSTLPDAVKAMCRPPGAGTITRRPVSRRVARTEVDGPALLGSDRVA